MKAKKPTAARKPAVKAKKASSRKPTASSRTPGRPAKKKGTRKKISVRPPRKPAKARKAVKAAVRPKVKQPRKPARAKVKKAEVVSAIPARPKAATRRIPLRKLSARPKRRIKRIVKLPAFLRRPARKTVRRIATGLATVAPEAVASREAGEPVSSATSPAPRRLSKSRAAQPAVAAPAGSAVPVPEKTAAPEKISSKVAAKTARLPAADEPGIALPAILFEGDSPAPVAVPPATGHASLPEAYGTQRVTVTARDPHWLCVHWDLTREQLRHYNAQSVHRHLVLRLHENKMQDEASGEIHVHPESRHWFVHVPRAAVKHVVELGYYHKGSGWERIAVSTPTATTAIVPVPGIGTRFATIPHDVTLPELARKARADLGGALPSVNVLHPDRNAAPPPEPMTPEMERAFAAVIRRQHPAFGAADSAGLGELLRNGLTENVSSLATAAGGGVSSLSSPQGGATVAPREFWFNLNAELVIYGATEPGASVTIGGRPVTLRTDGSFSHRFALPDGQYELPVTAVSADGTEARHADLKFARNTKLVGEVGQHPQDPALKTPAMPNT